MKEEHSRTALLLGERAMERLQNAYVAVIGLGGVGGHCAEALARAGVGRLHLVDGDVVERSNLNRQLVATKETLGMEKTAAMAKRIGEISDCEVTTKTGFLLPENAGDFLPDGLSYIVDAVDTVAAKIALAEAAKARNIPILSCMGAGNRLDPTAFHVTDVFQTEGCGLARAMRRGLRKKGIESLTVVCSREPARTPRNAVEGERPLPGSFAPVTAAAGLTLAAYVLRAIAGEDG